MANVLPLKVRARVVRSLVEGNSIKSAARLTKTNKDAVMRLEVIVGEGCQKLHDKLVRHVPGGTYEVDETWSFVGRHERRKKKTDPKWFGDQYTMFAMEADTKLVPAFKTGKRTLPTATAFMEDFRARVDGKPQITFDGWPHWIEATRRTFGHRGADVGMTVKEYQKECHPSDTARGCGRVKSQTKTVIYGEPDQKHITTAKAERLNLTHRTTDRRFTRLTNGYSKKLENHEASAQLHYFWYNFVRRHESLGTTPAVRAGIADHEWSIEKMTRAALAEMGEANPEIKAPRRFERKTHQLDADDAAPPAARPPPGAARVRAHRATSPGAVVPTPRPPAKRAAPKPSRKSAEAVAAPDDAPRDVTPTPRDPARRRAPKPSRKAAPARPTGCSGSRETCTCPDRAEARFHRRPGGPFAAELAALAEPYAPGEEPAAPLAKRDRSKERGFTTIEALGHVGLVGLGVVAVRRIDDAAKLEILGRPVPASGLVLGAAIAGAMLAHRDKSPRTASAVASLAVGLGAGMLGRAATRGGLLSAPKPETLSGGAAREPLWKRALRWLLGP